MIDLETTASKISIWAGAGTTIISAGMRLYASYQKVEPANKLAIQADSDTLKAEWQALDAAFSSYNSADNLSKIGALAAIASTISKAVPILTRIANDGETVFGADWHLMKPDVDLIVTTIKGLFK